MKKYFRISSDRASTYSFGIGRSLIALGLLITVSIDSSEILFAPDSTRFPLGRCDAGGVLEYTLFCILGFELGRWVSIFTFLIVLLGLFPALTAIPFAYAAWSLQASLAVPEGGDQLASNLAIIMLPISLLDWRISHWSLKNTGMDRFMKWTLFRTVVRVTSMIVLSIQMSIVYFFAAAEKLAVGEWLEGTAIYYWASDPNFGTVGIRERIFTLFTENSFSVVGITWGTLLLEFMLAFAWMSRGYLRIALMFMGIIFHLGIAVLMGLLSFSIIMCGALVLYLGTSCFYVKKN